MITSKVLGWTIIALSALGVARSLLPWKASWLYRMLLRRSIYQEAKQRTEWQQRYQRGRT